MIDYSRCIHYEVCSNRFANDGCEGTCGFYLQDIRPQGDLLKAFELLKAHCKNRECNKDCVFYRELRVGDNTEQFCNLCEIVMSDGIGEFVESEDEEE